MIVPVDAERHAEFSWTRAQIRGFRLFSPPLHRFNIFERFKGADEDKSIRIAVFDENVREPIHAVVEVNVGSSRLVDADELPSARAEKGVAGFVSKLGVGLGFDNSTAGTVPN